MSKNHKINELIVRYDPIPNTRQAFKIKIKFFLCYIPHINQIEQLQDHDNPIQKEIQLHQLLRITFVNIIQDGQQFKQAIFFPSSSLFLW